VQRLDIVVKLGKPFSSPLLRMKADASRYLSRLWISEEGGDDETTLGKRVDRSEVDRAPPLTEERRQDRESGRRHCHGGCDEAAETDRGSLQEAAA